MTLDFKIPKELRVKYIQRREENLLTLTNALSSGDFTAFKNIGHQLKGNAVSFGYSDLSELGERIELVGKTLDRELALQNIMELEAWLRREQLH